ncbi:hypothetical protein IV203_002396 [Nitzschia inconspicua]|uniref:Uncharacterized protein n=1 Tax=Nitzschia inconspicua TaxID=303405 RepID=A0A9K3LAA1_9STRA|nr:hypothetical protein IV203_002396 [Nitzschia inconspicua]
MPFTTWDMGWMGESVISLKLLICPSHHKQPQFGRGTKRNQSGWKSLRYFWDGRWQLDDFGNLFGIPLSLSLSVDRALHPLYPLLTLMARTKRTWLKRIETCNFRLVIALSSVDRAFQPPFYLAKEPNDPEWKTLASAPYMAKMKPTAWLDALLQLYGSLGQDPFKDGPHIFLDKFLLSMDCFQWTRLYPDTTLIGLRVSDWSTSCDNPEYH